jgi:hypothetical protein
VILDVSLAATNLARVVVNRVSKLARQLRQRARRGAKQVAESGKGARAEVRAAIASGRATGQGGYRTAVRAVRYFKRVERQVWPRVRREIQVRGELRRIAAGTRPIIVGPWLSEVGYEALYWIPFLRWFQDRYRVHRERLVVVSRGGVAGWYSDIADRYVELLDLFPPQEFAALNAERQAASDQKQHGISSFDEAILARLRSRGDLDDAAVCHPAAMFRLLRQFWLGNESLEYAQQYLRFAPVAPPPRELPTLPASFTAVKFYTGKAIPDTPANRLALRALVERLAAQGPVVTLDTGLHLDEHDDYLFRDLANVQSIGPAMTAANNLGVQTEVIRRSSRFVGTCGGLAWLAPMMGTPTVAVYADDDLLGPHLYAARGAYRAMSAAPFAPIDLNASALIDAGPV